MSLLKSDFRSGLTDVLTFGQYKGLTIDEIGNLDSKYISFLVKKGIIFPKEEIILALEKECKDEEEELFF
jgi:hypothetical protein